MKAEFKKETMEKVPVHHVSISFQEIKELCNLNLYLFSPSKDFLELIYLSTIDFFIKIIHN
jgi:hypothetical protein